jgi:hypothetical protein
MNWGKKAIIQEFHDLYTSPRTVRAVNNGDFNGLNKKLGLNNKCIQNFGMGTGGK